MVLSLSLHSRRPPLGAPRRVPALTGDWDVYIALSATPHFGFEGWRRMGFAHFAGADSANVGFLRRRTGQPMLNVAKVTTSGDSVLLAQDDRVVMRAAWHGDTLVGVQYNGDRALDRRYRLVRRATPGMVEQTYQVWKMPASDSQYATIVDTTTLMTARDGAKLETYVVRPVGPGPFGVVMQRSPYRASNAGPGRWWASHGYIFVGQLVRERGKSSGDVADFGDYSHDIQDGYDAVEWAAKLPGANGKVGLIGHSDEGRGLVRGGERAAASRRDRAIGRTSDPWRIVPYAAMVFGPINVDWVCLMRGRNMANNTAELDIGEAITHLPLSTLPQRLGCGDVPIWDRWIAHPTLDAYWRAHAATTFIDKVNAPALSLAGWHDDSRGPLDYTDALLRNPKHPAWHLVMGVQAHKGVDYVAGDYGPQARYRRPRPATALVRPLPDWRGQRRRQGPPVDIFVQGANVGAKRTSGRSSARSPTVTSRPPVGDRPRGTGKHDMPHHAAPRLTRSPTIPAADTVPDRLTRARRRRSTRTTPPRTPRGRMNWSSPRGLHKPLEITGPMCATVYASSDAQGHRLGHHAARCLP